MTTSDMNGPQRGPERIYQIMVEARSARSESFQSIMIALMKRIGSGAARLGPGLPRNGHGRVRCLARL